MNIIMSKLIRDVVMHWIYIEVWLTAKPFFISIENRVWVMGDWGWGIGKKIFKSLLCPIGDKHLSRLKPYNYLCRSRIKN